MFYQVSADQKPELEPLFLSPVLFPGVSHVLHSNPEFIHFGEVQENEVNRVLNTSGSVFLRVTRREDNIFGDVRQYITTRLKQIIAQKEASERVLNT